jgi:hypothetical protein
MEPTTDERLTQQIEEIKREVTESAGQSIVNPALEALEKLAQKYEERDRQRQEEMRQFLDEQRQQMADEYRQMRSDSMGAMSAYATKEEVEAKAEEHAAAQFAPILTHWQEHLADYNRERQRTQTMLNQQTEKMLALAQTAENRSIENEKEIARMKGENEQRFGQIERNIGTLRRDIDDSVKSVADSVKRVDSTFAQFIARSEKRIDKIEANASTVARDVARTGKLIGDLEDQRNEDIKEVRRIEGVVSRESNIVRDIEGRVILNMTQMNVALYGDEKEKEPGLVADMKTLKSGLWWQAWIGTNPRKAFLLAGAAYVVFLIVTAFVLNRPEIVAQMIPLGTNNAN